MEHQHTYEKSSYHYSLSGKRNIELSEQDHKEGIYVFKVSLGSIWARIAIPSGNTLDELSTSILDAFAFDYDHLYQFTYKNRFGDPNTYQSSLYGRTPLGF